MSEKFKNKYRIPSARLQKWNYAWQSPYFVTVCTHNMEHYFGEVIDGEMVLSEIGEIVNKKWLETFEKRPRMKLYMCEFVVMPNHFHAIIVIGENEFNGDTQGRRIQCVSMDANKFGQQANNLSSIMRGFKSSATSDAIKIHADFAWQPRFHDHIIRNQKSFDNITNYIKNNPSNWHTDKFYAP